MAAGSSFDAFVKNRIHIDVFGVPATLGSDYDFEKIFESQVEPHCRDEARALGKYLMDIYVSSGAYGELIREILESDLAPQMEFSITGTINGVTLTGKPDLRYFTKSGVHVIGDWKVNGAVSKHGVSPVQGYKIVRPKDVSHKKFEALDFRGLTINKHYLEDFSPDWATQLCIYAWVLGEQPGDSEFVVRMEQLACRPPGLRDPTLKVQVATHVARISDRFQMDVMRRLMEMNDALSTGHIFTDMTLQESIDNCDLLDKKADLPLGLHPAMDVALVERSPRWK